MGNFERLADATGRAGHRDAVHVAQQYLAFAFDELCGDVQVRRNSFGTGSGPFSCRHGILAPDSVPKPLLQTQAMRAPSRSIAQGNFGGDAGANNSRHIFNSRAPAVFLPPAVQQAGKPRPAIAIEHADALGSVETMGRERKQVRAQFLHIDGQPSRAGFGVNIEGDPSRPATSLISRIGSIAPMS